MKKTTTITLSPTALRLIGTPADQIPEGGLAQSFRTVEMTSEERVDWDFETFRPGEKLRLFPSEIKPMLHIKKGPVTVKVNNLHRRYQACHDALKRISPNLMISGEGKFKSEELLKELENFVSGLSSAIEKGSDMLEAILQVCREKVERLFVFTDFRTAVAASDQVLVAIPCQA